MSPEAEALGHPAEQRDEPRRVWRVSGAAGQRMLELLEATWAQEDGR